MPLIVNEVIDTAINIGMHAGGGYNKVNAAFYALREDCETKIEAGPRKPCTPSSGRGRTAEPSIPKA
jgi:hypothetical protein